MTPDRHKELAHNIERSLRHCGENDWEIQIEAAMLAGTHWANFALHQHGVSSPAEDIIHTSMLALNVYRKYSIVEQPMMEALAEIEELRPLFVRGDVAGGDAAAERALALLKVISERAQVTSSQTGVGP